MVRLKPGQENSIESGIYTAKVVLSDKESTFDMESTYMLRIIVIPAPEPEIIETVEEEVAANETESADNSTATEDGLAEDPLDTNGTQAGERTSNRDPGKSGSSQSSQEKKPKPNSNVYGSSGFDASSLVFEKPKPKPVLTQTGSIDKSGNLELAFNTKLEFPDWLKQDLKSSRRLESKAKQFVSELLIFNLNEDISKGDESS